MGSYCFRSNCFHALSQLSLTYYNISIPYSFSLLFWHVMLFIGLFPLPWAASDRRVKRWKFNKISHSAAQQIPLIKYHDSLVIAERFLQGRRTDGLTNVAITSPETIQVWTMVIWMVSGQGGPAHLALDGKLSEFYCFEVCPEEEFQAKLCHSGKIMELV